MEERVNLVALGHEFVESHELVGVEAVFLLLVRRLVRVRLLQHDTQLKDKLQATNKVHISISYPNGINSNADATQTQMLIE